MTTTDWLLTAQQTLGEAVIATARLDALVLLEDQLGRDRAHLLAHPETKLSPAQLASLNVLVARRAKHEPLAYIRGKSEFYGREFYVDHRVLEPRPESETIITLLKQLACGSEDIVDVGTGSGMLAITAKLELPAASVTATDIDAGCLAVAKQNAQSFNADVTLLKGDLLEPKLQKSRNLSSTILLCNLPYVPDDFQINKAALQEPRLAIFGGPDGLDLYRALFAQIAPLAAKPGLILTESLPPQHPELASIARAHGYVLQQTDDFIQVFSI